MEAQDGDHTDLLAQAQSILQKHAQPAGLSAAIASSHSLPYHLLQDGLADIPHSSPVHSEHVFGIGSITKVFLAVVVLQLVEQGKLALSDCLGEYLAPEVLRDIDIAQGVTIEQLLGHTAGIDSWEDDPVWIRHGRGRDVRPDHIWSKTEPLDYIRRPRSERAAEGGLVLLEYKLYSTRLDCRDSNAGACRDGDPSSHPHSATATAHLPRGL